MPFLERLGLHRPELRAWALYDWANSAFWATVILIFPFHFSKVACVGAPAAVASSRFAWSTTIAMTIIALLSPLLGAIADYAGAKKLFDDYGIHFDPKVRDEIVARVDKLQLPSYTGFVMPKLTAVTDAQGSITEVTISYPQDLTKQMLEYSGAKK